MLIESEEEDIKDAIQLISAEDKMKLKLCPYRFALEGIEQGRTIFRDRFLIHSYLKILIGNSVKKKLNGKPYSDEIIKKSIQEEYDVIEVRFRISDELEKTQLLYFFDEKI